MYPHLLLLLLLATFSLEAQNLIWAEEFDGPTLDTNIWNFNLGDGCPQKCGWGNNERQIYTDSNHRIEDGKLVITARLQDGGYTSTRITTKDNFQFQYGRAEARLQLPQGTGVWPAFWMLGANIDEVGWPRCGEVDILEYVGRDPHMAYNALHTQASHGRTVHSNRTYFPDLETGFHVYAVEWSADEIAFYIDDQMTYSVRPSQKSEEVWPYEQPFYLLLNLAIGGNFGGPKVDDSIFPQTYVIDYVRLFKR